MKAKLKKSGKVKIILDNQSEINLFAALIGATCGRVELAFSIGDSSVTNLYPTYEILDNLSSENRLSFNTHKLDKE